MWALVGNVIKKNRLTINNNSIFLSENREYLPHNIHTKVSKRCLKFSLMNLLIKPDTLSTFFFNLKERTEVYKKFEVYDLKSKSY